MSPCRHDWQATERRVWTRFGGVVLVYRCERCDAEHEGMPRKVRNALRRAS
jgi:hypothetical protein